MSLGDLRIISNDEVEWRVPDLDAPKMEDSSSHASPEFHIRGERWKLSIHSEWLGQGTLVRLGRVSVGPLCTVQFSVALKAANGQKEYETRKMAVFRHYATDTNRLLSRKEYRRRKSELCTSGSITIVCKIKILSAEDLCVEFIKLKQKYEDSQLKLEETEKEKDDIKEELDACKSEKEIISKEKLSLEVDLKDTSENLDFVTKEFCKLRKKYNNVQLTLERTVKEKDEKKELDGCWADKGTRENFGETFPSASSKVCDHDKILRDFKQLLLNQENSDVLLRVRGQEFQAHRAILAARSPVFASTFRNDMKEKETGIVDIEDCDPSSFPDFLSFIYSNDVGTLSEGNVFDIFMAADKYDVMELRRKCLEYMKENVSLDTFCETLTVSLQHNKTELIHVCTDFFIKNAEEILETVKWQMFATENPIQSNELFIKYVKSMKQLNK